MARASANAEDNALTGMVSGAGGSYTGSAAYFGLNSTDPGTTGAAEISGGAPAYARVAITWGTASAGSVANATSALTLNVPAATTVAYFSTWGAATGTTGGGSMIGGALNTSVTFNSQGTFSVAVGGLQLSAS
jgi:hypothetical protein